MTIFKTDSNENEFISDVLERLNAEYGIIQGKIDNIGEFKFKVRGWLITIYSAFLYSIFSGQVSILFCIPLGGFIVLIFYFLEREQVILQHRLSNRAKKIEKAIYVLGQKIYEIDENRERLIKSILKEIESTPRIAVIITSGQRIEKSKNIRFKWSFSQFKRIWLSQWQKFKSYYKTYWLFIVLSALTMAIYFVATDKWVTKNVSLIANADPTRPDINIITNNNVAKSVNKKDMRANAEIEKVEEEMSSLVSQIDFGDISDIDAYWDSLGEALLDLPINNWINKPPTESDVSTILGSIDVPTAAELCNLALEMDELCDSGSNSSINEEALEKLQKKASKFEGRFNAFLSELDELMK